MDIFIFSWYYMKWTTGTISHGIKSTDMMGYNGSEFIDMNGYRWSENGYQWIFMDNSGYQSMLMEIIGYEWDINGIWKDRLMGYTFLSGLSTAGLPNMMRIFFYLGLTLSILWFLWGIEWYNPNHQYDVFVSYQFMVCIENDDSNHWNVVPVHHFETNIWHVYGMSP
jgi:hypothetical protein